MKLRVVGKLVPITALLSAIIVPLTGIAANGNTSQDATARTLQARLGSYQEVPAISSMARGDFQAQIDDSTNTIAYQLNYADLDGSATMAHIHFAQKGVNGAVVVPLCDNTGGATSRVQSCPAAPATITGTITAADVTAGATNQGIDAGEIAELITAMRNGVTYANVHSSKFPQGEMRGQIKVPKTTSGNGGNNSGD